MAFCFEIFTKWIVFLYKSGVGKISEKNFMLTEQNLTVFKSGHKVTDCVYDLVGWSRLLKMVPNKPFKSFVHDVIRQFNTVSHFFNFNCIQNA